VQLVTPIHFITWSMFANMRLKAKRGQSSSAQSPQCCGGICILLRGGEAVPSDGLCSVLRNTFTILKHGAQVELSVYISLIRGKAVQSHSLGIVLRNTLAVLKHGAQVDLSGCIPLIRGKAVYSRTASA
jgi:hypothetical protein